MRSRIGALGGKQLCLALSLIFSLLSDFSVLAQTCRTPGHTGYILFEPCAYAPMYDHSQYCDSALSRQGYTRINHYWQQWEPGFYPSVRLDSFALAMADTGLAVFFISSLSIRIAKVSALSITIPPKLECSTHWMHGTIIPHMEAMTQQTFAWVVV